MDALVHYEVGVRPEGLAALRAPEGLLAAVVALVHQEVGMAAEGLLAVGALEWLLPRVRPLVEGEACAAVEGFVALRALEWLVTAVDLLMHGERGVAGKGLAAPALVGLLASVDAEVASEVRMLVEGLAILSPVCTLRCMLSSKLQLKAFSQAPHL